MAVTFNYNGVVPLNPLISAVGHKSVKASKNGRKAVPPTISLDQPGRLRIAHLQYLLGISHSTVYKRMEQGLIPPPDGYDLKNRPKGKQGRPYWNTATIRKLLEG